MKDIIQMLTAKDEKEAYETAKKIVNASKQSPEYYPYLEEIASLLNNKKSYVRTRAFILCCSQARWDTNGKLKDLFPKMVPLLHDEKPTVVRQSLNALREMIEFCPKLRDEIKKELELIDLSGYKDSMTPLIQKDIGEVMKLLAETAEKEKAGVIADS